MQIDSGTLDDGRNYRWATDRRALRSIDDMGGRCIYIGENHKHNSKDSG